jgi:sterol 3beta-glucosyltransferase
VRIALATVGTTGDVRPFAALAAALGGRGHEVDAVSWELHRPAFEAAGARFQAVGPDTSWEAIGATARRAAEAPNPQRQVVVLREFHLRDGAAHYRALREALGGHDLLVLHGIHSIAEAAARDSKLRYATAVFDPILLPTGDHPPAGMPSLGPLNRAGWWLLDRMLASAGRPLRDLLSEAVSPSAETVKLFRARSPWLHLVACSPSIAQVPRDLPATVAFTGAWVAQSAPDPLPAEVAAFLAAGPPPAVVSFGSMAADAQVVMPAVVGGLRQAGLRAIVQSGTANLAPVRSDTILPIGAVDHRALFPRAAVVVHHGGAGTSHAVAAAGVPSVVVPHVGDQAYWADRLHQLGVAPPPMPIGRLSAEALASRLAQATSDERRASAARLANQVKAEDGVSVAIDRLEAVAADQS